MACLDVRQTLIQQLKGQDLRIPDLSLLFKQWPKDASPYLESLRILSGERIARYDIGSSLDPVFNSMVS